MRVLLTNDDGFFAPGMTVLKNVVSRAFSEIWISSPAQNCSGMSRSISAEKPLDVGKVSDREFVVGGTPVDSAILGLHIMKEAGVKPDLVISGINRGSNVASKVLYSGTIAAAAVTAAAGIPSFAISQEYRNTETNWNNSESVLLDLIEQLMKDDRWNKKSVMSINIPHAKIIGSQYVEQGVYCPSGSIIKREEKVCSNSATYTICNVNEEVVLERFGKTSHELLHEGYIIITPLGADLTDHETLGLYLNNK